MDTFEKRRRNSEKYSSSASTGATVKPPDGIRFSCPCCGYPMLHERGSYEICGPCNWEDDGQDDPESDKIWGGPNEDYSLTEARGNFVKFLIMYSPDKLSHRIGGNTNSAIEEQAKRAIIAAFDSLFSEDSPPAQEELWKRVIEGEEVLYSEVKRGIQEHEARMKRQCGPGER